MFTDFENAETIDEVTAIIVDNPDMCLLVCDRHDNPVLIHNVIHHHDNSFYGINGNDATSFPIEFDITCEGIGTKAVNRFDDDRSNIIDLVSDDSPRKDMIYSFSVEESMKILSICRIHPMFASVLIGIQRPIIVEDAIIALNKFEEIFIGRFCQDSLSTYLNFKYCKEKIIRFIKSCGQNILRQTNIYPILDDFQISSYMNNRSPCVDMLVKVKKIPCETSDIESTSSNNTHNLTTINRASKSEAINPSTARYGSNCEMITPERTKSQLDESSSSSLPSNVAPTKENDQKSSNLDVKFYEKPLIKSRSVSYVHGESSSLEESIALRRENEARLKNKRKDEEEGQENLFESEKEERKDRFTGVVRSYRDNDKGLQSKRARRSSNDDDNYNDRCHKTFELSDLIHCSDKNRRTSISSQNCDDSVNDDEMKWNRSMNPKWTLPESTTVDDVFFNNPKRPIVPHYQNKLFCINYHIGGHCKTGKKCRFLHADPRSVGRDKVFDAFCRQLLSRRNTKSNNRS